MMASPVIAAGGLALVVAAPRRARCPRRCRSSLLWAAAPLVALRAQPARADPRAPCSARRTASSSRRSRARPGGTSRRSPAPRITRCRPTTSRSCPELTRRAPHLADQHRHGAARDARGARPRLHRHRRARRRGSTRRSRTVESLERFEGHLLNWYDTQTLAPLLPALRLDRRQRQPRRRARDARRGAAQLARRTTDRWQRSPAWPIAPARSRTRMNFRFLYDPQRQLFAIGYRLADAEGPGRLDPSYYDLLASEARLASFLAHRQGRRARVALVPPRTAGHERARRAGAAVVERHDVRVPDAAAPHAELSRTRCSTSRAGWPCAGRSSTGATRGVPWGISESAYNVVDRHGNYQYKAFGVPGPRPEARPRRRAGGRAVRDGARRDGRPAAAAPRNLRRLAADGLEGDYGFFDAIDYTAREADQPRTRRPRGGARDAARWCAPTWRTTRA